MTGVRVSSSPASGDTYLLGKTIRVTLTFTHTVAEPNYSSQGIAVLANSLALNGGTIRSSSTRTNAELSHIRLNHNASHKVDWQRSPDGGPGS